MSSSDAASALELFRYQATDVRVVLIDTVPWFVAADVCTVLTIGNPRQAVSYLDDDEKGVTSSDTPGGVQQMTIVNESGLYSLILRSRKPEAKAFKRWVTHDVLPTIRRTGRYGSDLEMLAELPSSELLLLASQAAKRAEEARARAAQLEGPARAWSGLASAAGDYTVSDAAKVLQRGGAKTGPRRLFGWLEANGWIFRRGQRWQAMQTVVARGWMAERVTGGYFDEVTGERKQADPQVRVTAAGLERLLAELRPTPVLPGSP